MKTKINEKFICIPPYISTNWDQVMFLESEEDEGILTLLIHMKDGRIVHIPEIDLSLLDIAFSSHMKFLEESSQAEPFSVMHKEGRGIGIMPISSEQLSKLSLRLGLPLWNETEAMEMALQHNPSQANAPDLPQDFLEKIAYVTKTMIGGDIQLFPKPEPHCNCKYCQVARVVHNLPKEESTEEDMVSIEELQFRDWDITLTGNQLYTVTNPLDSVEQYTVYLGSPVGCTCGQDHCEHIRAVLNSDA